MTRRLAMTVAAGAVAAAAAWACPAPAAAQIVEPHIVYFTAQDGVQVGGSLFLPDRLPAPAVVLLPMAARTRHDWDTTAMAFARGGVAALAIDFRAVGLPADGATEQIGSLADLVRDADAARAYLAARPDIVPSRIGMAGASLGANVAALAAAGDPVVRSIALLSASLDYRGLRIEQAITKYGNRPALLVASSEDPFALRTARTLATTGAGQRELRILSDAGHGTVMLGRQPDLVDALVDWFLRTLL